MKITQVVQTEKFIKELLETELPVALSLKLKEFVTYVDPHLIAFKEGEQELVKKYGTEVEPGQWKIEEAKQKAYAEDLEKLNITLDPEYTENENFKIKPYEFGGAYIKPSIIINLQYLIG